MHNRYARWPRLMYWYRKWQGVNDEPEMALLPALCDPGKLSVDIGGKLGMYTGKILKHSRTVVVFEPIPVLANLIGKVFPSKRVRVENLALSDTQATTTMRIPFGANGEPKYGRSTIEDANTLTHDGVAAVDTIQVGVRTLDDMGLADVGFIKIDVEGHELAVLRGAMQTLRSQQPTVLVEANDLHRPGAVGEVLALMQAAGYRALFLERGALRPAADHPPTYFQTHKIENFIFLPQGFLAEPALQRLAATAR